MTNPSRAILIHAAELLEKSAEGLITYWAGVFSTVQAENEKAYDEYISAARALRDMAEGKEV